MFDVLICLKIWSMCSVVHKKVIYMYKTSVINIKYFRIQCITAVIDVEDVYDVLNINAHIRWCWR